MRNIRFGRKYDINEINYFSERNGEKLIADSENRMSFDILGAAGGIIDAGESLKAVLVAGPSASGKTTFAKRLCEVLCAAGTEAKLVSLDDFYLGLEYLPKNEDGTYDMESISGFDLAGAHKCFADLAENGEADFPVFDFPNQRRSSKTNRISLGKNGVLVIEGIYALNPQLTEGIPAKDVMRIYVSTQSRYDSYGRTVLSAGEVRLLRRAVRDELFRGWPAEKTLAQWKSVLKGEETYINPYIRTADMHINTSLAYEPAVLKAALAPALAAITKESPFFPEAENLMDKLSCFDAINRDIVPKDSILHEFIG